MASIMESTPMQGTATSENIVGDISATQFCDMIIVARSTPLADEELKEGSVVSAKEMSDTERERTPSQDSTDSTEGSDILKDKTDKSGSVSPVTSDNEEIVHNEEGYSAAAPHGATEQDTMPPSEAQMTFEDVVRSQLKRDKKGLRADAREFKPCKDAQFQQQRSGFVPHNPAPISAHSIQSPGQQFLGQDGVNNQMIVQRSDLCPDGMCQNKLAQMDQYVMRQIEQLRRQGLAIADKDIVISSQNNEIQKLNYELCVSRDVDKFYKHENETLRAQKLAAEKKTQDIERKLQSLEDKTKYNKQLQGAVEGQKRTIEDQKATVEKQDNLILDLKVDISNRDHEIAELKADLTRKEEEKKCLEKRLSKVEEKNEKLMTELPDMRMLEAANAKLSREYGELEKNVAKLKAHKCALPKAKEAGKKCAKNKVAAVKDSNTKSAAPTAEDSDHETCASAAKGVDAAGVFQKTTNSGGAGKTSLQLKAAQNSASSIEQARKSSAEEQRPVSEATGADLLLSSVLFFILTGIM